MQDIRFALRMLAKNPGFTAIAALTLALGIGANTSVFSVANAVLLRPLPYRDPGTVVSISESSPQFPDMSVSYLNYVDWKKQNRSFSQMCLFRTATFNLSGAGVAEHLNGREVSAGFLSLLGVQPALGRDILPEDDRPGAAPVVIISHGLWQQRFGSNPQILGKSITLTDQNYTIVGVLPEKFWFYHAVDVYLPTGAAPGMWQENRELRSGAYVVARLKPSVKLSEARAEMTQIAARLAEAYPKANAAHGINVRPMLDDVVGDVRSNLYLLLGAVGFVLLIACVNVANLLLVRATARQREIAVREALGGTRLQVVRLLLIESVCLAALGGILGVFFARWGTAALVAAVPGSLPRSAQGVGMDGRVLLFTSVVTLLTGIFFGLAPALRASGGDVHETLKEGARGSTGKRHRLQDLLVVAELALALVLLVGAGLTIRSIVELNRVDPGFDPKHALTFNVSLSESSYPTAAKVRGYFREMVQRLESVPGVQAATLSLNVPMRDDSEVFFYVAGRPIPPPQQMPWAMHYLVSPGYKDAMGLRLIKGRFLSRADAETSAPVVVIDEVMSRGLFPNENPLGHSLVIPFPGFDQPREIVGVVNHVKHWGLAQDATARIQYQFYMPFDQIPDNFFTELRGNSLSLIVRTASEPHSLAGAMRETAQSLDKDQPVFEFQSLDGVVRDSLAAQRFATLLLGIFAGVALFLAAVGIYGVMSYIVSERTHEVGIRMALGATRKEILRLILQHGSLLALAGTGAGLLIAFGLTRLLSGLLYGVKPTDPVTFAGVGVLLAGVALLACFMPARRATHVDPMVALRYE